MGTVTPNSMLKPLTSPSPSPDRHRFLSGAGRISATQHRTRSEEEKVRGVGGMERGRETGDGRKERRRVR